MRRWRGRKGEAGSLEVTQGEGVRGRGEPRTEPLEPQHLREEGNQPRGNREGSEERQEENAKRVSRRRLGA